MTEVRRGHTFEDEFIPHLQTVRAGAFFEESDQLYLDLLFFHLFMAIVNCGRGLSGKMPDRKEEKGEVFCLKRQQVCACTPLNSLAILVF